MGRARGRREARALRIGRGRRGHVLEGAFGCHRRLCCVLVVVCRFLYRPDFLIRTEARGRKSGVLENVAAVLRAVCTGGHAEAGRYHTTSGFGRLGSATTPLHRRPAQPIWTVQVAATVFDLLISKRHCLDIAIQWSVLKISQWNLSTSSFVLF